LQVERVLDELRVNLNQELVAIKLAEPLDPSDLLVLNGRIIRECINVVLIFIRFAIVVLLHGRHLLLLATRLTAVFLRLHRRLFVETRCFHFQFND